MEYFCVGLCKLKDRAEVTLFAMRPRMDGVVFRRVPDRSDPAPGVPPRPYSSARAPRLRVEVPVAYRKVTDERWSRGATVDISRSGVLFVPSEPTAPSGDLLLVVFLSQTPVDADGVRLPLPDLYCGGRVARVAETDGKPALAMQIEFEWVEKPGEHWDLPPG